MLSGLHHFVTAVLFEHRVPPPARRTHPFDERGFIPPLTSEAVVVWQSEPARFPAGDPAHRHIRPVPGQFHVTVQH